MRAISKNFQSNQTEGILWPGATLREKEREAADNEARSPKSRRKYSSNLSSHVRSLEWSTTIREVRRKETEKTTDGGGGGGGGGAGILSPGRE